jgi:hypothetical protein
MCSSKELHKILNTIKPDVIFEELSKQYFSEIYNGRKSDTLETITIKVYSKEKIFKHHPVDVDVNQLVAKDLKNSISNMHKIFDRNSDYQNLKLTLQNLSFKFRFPFLNGIQCEIL